MNDKPKRKMFGPKSRPLQNKMFVFKKEGKKIAERVCNSCGMYYVGFGAFCLDCRSGRR